MRTLVAAAVLLSIPSFVCAQSLGEVAAREKERRNKAANGKPTKVITETDLGGRLSTGTVSHPEASDVAAAPADKKDGAKAADAAGGEKKEKTEDEIRADRSKDWHERSQRARDEVSRLQARVDELQSSLGGAPAVAYGARGTAVNQLDQAKRELATAQQQVTQLEDEGRRNGFR